MSKLRIAQIVGSILAIAAVLPAGLLAAKYFDAYELIWLIPFLPAFTVTFFWIVTVMVGHFIQADTYKDPRAIHQAKSFLVFFDWLFIAAIIFFVIAGFFLRQYFSSRL